MDRRQSTWTNGRFFSKHVQTWIEIYCCLKLVLVHDEKWICHVVNPLFGDDSKHETTGTTYSVTFTRETTYRVKTRCLTTLSSPHGEDPFIVSRFSPKIKRNICSMEFNINAYILSVFVSALLFRIFQCNECFFIFWNDKSDRDTWKTLFATSWVWWS